MSAGYEFDGSIEIDGNTDSNRISVFFAYCNEVAIHGAQNRGLLKKTLYLQPFDIYMLRKSDSSVMKEGFHYSISGTKVGAISYGPLGHPGDGEYDHRPIKHFELRCKYSSNELLVLVEGITEEGVSGFEQYRNKPIPPWRFKVHFIVPRADMKKFFGFKDFNYPFFEKALNACC